MIKACSKCLRELHEVFFHRNRTHADGRHSVCIECRKAGRTDRQPDRIEPAGGLRWTYAEDMALLSAGSLKTASCRLGRSYDSVRLRRQYLNRL